MSFYEPDPDVRVATWLRAIWRRRGTVESDSWRLHFVVVVDGRPVGEQTLTGLDFARLGTVTAFSWLSAGSGPRARARDAGRRSDIQIHSLEACHAMLPLS